MKHVVNDQQQHLQQKIEMNWKCIDGIKRNKNGWTTRNEQKRKRKTFSLIAIYLCIQLQKKYFVSGLFFWLCSILVILVAVVVGVFFTFGQFRFNIFIWFGYDDCEWMDFLVLAIHWWQEKFLVREGRIHHQQQHQEWEIHIT